MAEFANKRVLLVQGHGRNYAYVRALEAGFRKAGWEPKLFVQNKKLRFALPVNDAHNFLIYLKCLSFKPSLLWVGKGDTLFPGLITLVKRLGIVTAVWLVDDLFFYHQKNRHRTILSEYDYVFSYDRFNVEEVARRGGRCFYLPCCAVDEKTHNVFFSGAKDFPITFIGSHLKNREEFLTALVRKKPDLPLKIFGPGWERIGRGHPLAAKIDLRKSFDRGAAELMNRSAITLNVHHHHTIDAVNQRVFEALACRTFLLTEDTPAVRRHFVPGEDLAVYRDPDDLLSMLDYYVTRPDEAARIAENGMKKVHAGHFFEHRVGEALDVLRRELARK